METRKLAVGRGNSSSKKRSRSKATRRKARQFFIHRGLALEALEGRQLMARDWPIGPLLPDTLEAPLFVDGTARNDASTNSIANETTMGVCLPATSNGWETVLAHNGHDANYGDGDESDSVTASVGGSTTVPPSLGAIIGQPAIVAELPRIHGIAVADAVHSGDFYTAPSATVTVTATLGKPLAAGQSLRYSVDDGVNWQTVASTAISNGTQVQLHNLVLPSALTPFDFAVFDGGTRGPTTRQWMEVDTSAPVVTLTGAVLNQVTGELSLQGTGLNSLLGGGEGVASDVASRLNWSNLRWDVQPDGSASVSFSQADARYARVASDSRFVIGLSAEKLASLSAMTGFGPGDTVNVTAGFLRDPAGRAATGDQLTNQGVWLFGAASQRDGRIDVRDDLRLSFPGNISRGTGLLQLIGADGTVEETFDAATSTALTFEGQSVIIDPIQSLRGSYAYSITLSAGSIATTAGTSYGGLSDLSTLSFATAVEIRDVAGATSIRDQYPGSAGVESIGNHRALYIPVTFASDNRAPLSVVSMQQDDILPTAEYYLGNAQGAITFNAEYTPVVTLPYTYAWHSQFDSQYNGLGLLMSQAREIVRRMGYDFNTYDVTILRFSDHNLRGGASFGGGSSVWLGWGGMGVTAHEAGHALDLPHSNSITWAGVETEYGNQLDVMGNGGGPDADLILDRKVGLGWIEGASRLLDPGPGIYRIHGVDQVNRVVGQNYGFSQRIAADSIGSNPLYSLEYRPSITGLGSSVLVLRNTNIIDLTPATGTQLDAGIQLGQTLAIPGSNSFFTVIDVRDGYADLAYQSGPFPDNVAPTATLNASATSVAPAGTVNFTATAVDANGDAMVYYWEFSDGVRGSGPSYSRAFPQTTATAVTGTLTVSDMRGGTISRTVTINAGAATTSTPQTVGSVTNPSFSKPRVAVTASDGFAAEGGDTGTFTFTRVGAATTAALTVNFTFSGNTSDFASLPSSISIPAGQAQASLTLTAIDDTALEAVERLVLTVSSATAYDVSTQNGSATLTLGDNDAPVVTIETVDGTAAEGSPDTGLLLIRRTGPTTEPMTVYYGLTGDAFNGGDYSRLDGHIVIPAGEAAVTLSIVAVDDEVGEPDETATIHLTSFNGAYSVGTASSASVTVKDNADPPEINLRLERGAGRNEGGSQRIYVDISGGTGAPATVYYTVGGTATAGVDYKALSGSIVVPTGGRQSIILPVESSIDSDYEHSETVTLALSPSPSYVVGSLGTAMVEIMDIIDTSVGGDRVNVSRFPVDVISESTTDIRFYVYRENQTENRTPLTVTYSLAGTASPGADYTGRLLRLDGTVAGTFTPQASGNTLTIPANANGLVVVLDLVNDSVAEGMETVALRLESVAGTMPFYPLGYNREAVYSIEDNDPHAILVGFESLATLAGEDGEFHQRTLSLPVTLNQASTDTVTVRFSAAGGTATGLGSDYTFLDPATGEPTMSGTLVFEPGSTRQILRLRVVADPIPEDAETIRVLLESPTRSSLAALRHQHTVTVYDTIPSGLFKEERWAGTTVYSGNTWDTATPSSIGYLTGPTAQMNVASDYSRRLSGVFTAPVSGEYRFYVSADDQARLYLSGTPSANDKQLIASLSSWSNFQQWDKFTTQQSAAISLQAGQNYYLEAQQFDASGADHLSVGWKMPGSSIIVPMSTASTPAATENRYVRFVTATSNAVEGGPGPEILVTLDRPNPLSETVVNVSIDTSLSSAVASDVSLGSTTLTFAAGETTKRLAVSAVADGNSEPLEVLRIRLASAAGAIIAGLDSHNLNIRDANAPTLAKVTATVSRSATAGTVVASLPVTLAAGRTAAAWEILAGNAVVAGSDLPAFSIDSSGVLRLANPAALPLGNYNQVLVVSVRDSAGASAAIEALVAIGGGESGVQTDSPTLLASYPNGVGTFSLDTVAGTNSGTAASIADGETTRDTTLRLTGSARAGNSVRLYSGAFRMGETTADGNGQWKFRTPVLGDGGHLLRAEVIDAAGNIGVSAPRTYYIRSRLDLDSTFLLTRAPGVSPTAVAASRAVSAVKAVATVDQGVVAYEAPFSTPFQSERWTGRAVYDNASWDTVAPDASSSSSTLVSSDSVVGANSRRVRGTITPPSTGSYVFYIAGDDEAKLFLNPAGTAASAKQQIASVPGWTNFQQWTKHAAQKSAPFTLTAGQSYYIEANLMGLGGTDHVSVGWTVPGSNAITPIAVITDIIVSDSARGTVQIATQSVGDANVGGGAPTTFGGLAPDGGKLVFGTSFPSAFGANGTSFVDANSLPSGPYTDLIALNRGTNTLQLLTSGATSGTTVSRQAEFVGITPDSQYAVFTTDHIEALGGFTAPGKALPTWPVVEGGFPTSSGTVKTTALRVADLDPTKMVFQLSGTGIASVASQLFEEQRFTGQTIYTNNTAWDSTTPAYTGYLTSMTPPQDVGSSYSRRLRGAITAPATGEYFFYVAADDAARLYLSTTDSAAQKTEIASVSSFTGFQQWSESAPRRSSAITLQAGQRYYIEVQHSEGSGGDHVSVAWKGPGITTITPIAAPTQLTGLAASASVPTIQRTASSLSFWVEAVENGVAKAVKLTLTDTADGIRAQAVAAKSQTGTATNVDWETSGTAATVATAAASAGWNVSVAGVTGSNLTATMINEVGLAPARDVVAYHFGTGVRTLLSHSSASGNSQSQAADIRDVTLSKDGRFVLFTAADATKLGNDGVAFTDSAPLVRDWFAADIQTGRITLLTHASGNLTQSAGAALTLIGTSDMGSYAVFSAANVAPFGFTDSDVALADLISVQMETGAVQLITRGSNAAPTTSAAFAATSELIQGAHVYFRTNDATRFGFASDGNTANQDLLRFNLATGGMEVISRTVASANAAFHGTYATGTLAVSPNGRFVAFEANLTGSGSGFTVSVNGRAQMIHDTETGAIRLLNASNATGGTLSYAAWAGSRPRVFTPDSRAVIWQSNYLGWHAMHNRSLGPGASDESTVAAFVMDITNGVMPVGTNQMGELLSHGPDGSGQIANGGGHSLAGVSPDSRFAFYLVNDASRFGNNGISFADTAPTMADLLAIDLATRNITLVTGQDGNSYGLAATFLAATDGGGIVISAANVAGIRTPAGPLSDGNGGTDILSTRTQLLSVATSDKRSGGGVGPSFTLHSRLIPGMEATLLRDGQVVDRRTADTNGVILWPLTNVPSGVRVFRLEYPGQQIPIAMVDNSNTSTLTVTVASSGTNQAPTDIELSNAVLAENAGSNAVVGTLSAIDPDTSDTFSFTLVAGDGSTNNPLFNISGTQLRATSSLNFEFQTSYSVRVRVADADGATFEKVFEISVTDVNEPASNITLSNASVAENAGANTLVGTLAAIDPDAANSHTFALAAGAGDSDNALFSVSVDQLRAIGSFDFEAKNSYSVRVRATDQDGLTFDKVLTVAITNVNEAPTALAISNATVREAAGANAVVGVVSTTDPDSGGTFTYTLVSGVDDTDNALFNLSDSQLRATNSLSSATKSSYSVRIRSTDQGGLSFERAFTITLTPPNQAPTDIALSNAVIAENSGPNAVVGSLSTTDPDAGNTFTYSLVDGTGATGNALFNINGTQLRATQSLDYDAVSSHSVRIRTTDQDGQTFERVFTITVSNVNESPTNVALSIASITENSGPNAVVGAFSTTDPDASDTFTYTLVAGTGATDNAAFNIAGSSLRATSTFDFEAKNNYSIRVRATDQGGLQFEKALAISVLNANEAPTNIALSNATVAENAGANAVVGTLSTTDPDAGGTFTYSLAPGANDTDNSLFNVNGSQLRATASLFASTKTSYSVRLKATDQGGLATEKAFTITLTGVTPNQPPTNITLSASGLAENAGDNAVVGTLSTADPNAGNTFTYALVTGTGATDNALFNIAGNQLRATASLNFESKPTYSVRLRTTDQGGLKFEKAFTISVTNVNEPPTDISLSAATIPENAGVNAVVGTLQAVDPDAGATITYTLVTGAGGDDNSRFNISGGRLRANESFDFESKSAFTVRVRAVDQAGLAFEKPLVVNVRNVNEAPNSLVLANNSVNENVLKDTLVGTLSATDPDSGDSLAYRFAAGVGDTGNKQFKIQGNRLLTSASLNYELQSVYSVRVQAVDRGGLVVDKVFSINVNDMNEAPRGLTLANVTVPENAGADAVVGGLVTVDSDTNDNFTYTLVAGAGDTNNSAFNIAGNQLRATASLDFETKSKYSVRIRTSDKGGLFFDRSFAVTVINVNDAPTNITLSKASIAENAGGNAPVGKLTAIDPDKGNAFTFSLVAGEGATDNSLFNIATDQLVAANSLNFEAKSTYSVRVRATDQGRLSFEKVFTIAATNVNEAPTAITLSNASIVEGAGANALVGDLSTTDPDAGEAFSYTLVKGTGDAGNAAFTIAGNQLRAKASLNRTVQSSYSVRVRAKDRGGLVYDQVFTISVTQAPSAAAVRVVDRGEGESVDAVFAQPFADPLPRPFSDSRRLFDGYWAETIGPKRQPTTVECSSPEASSGGIDALFTDWNGNV